MYCISNPRIDLHNHFWVRDNPHRKDRLKMILNSMKRAGIDICALVSDRDCRYDCLVWEQKPRQMRVDYLGNCIVIDGKKIIFRGEEVYTDKGSLVLAGAKRTLWEPGKTLNLEDALITALIEKAFILIPHIYLKFGGLQKNIEEAWRYADAIEINPFCSNEQNNEAKRFAEKHHISVISSSDARHPRETGRGFFRMKGDFVFEDGEQAVQMLREGVKNGVLNYSRPANWFEIARYLIKSKVG